ncbi:MAG: NADP-dependent oxidoreductase [Succinivibrio sp.]
MHKAVVFDRFGGPEVLRIAELDEAEPGPSQCLIKVMACGVNPIDAKIRAGRNFVCEHNKDRPFPWTLGYDCAGVVEKAGPGSVFNEGDRIFGQAGFPYDPRGYAQMALVDDDSMMAMPQGVPFEAAAASVSAGLTALTIMRMLPPPPLRVLVSGATGGVGHILVRALLKRGYAVAGTASAGKLDFLRSLGDVEAHDYSRPLPRELERSFGAIVDMPGGRAGMAMYGYLEDGGLLVSVPTITAKEVCAAAPERVRASGVLASHDEELRRELVRMLEAGVLPHVSETLALTECARAHELIGSGHTAGKIVLIP